MYSYGSPHTAAQKQDDQHERTFSSYVRIQVVVLKTYLGRWTIGRSGERGSGISVLPARYDDDDLNTRLWCNGYRCRKCTRRHEFKSWTRLTAFHIALIPFGKVWIHSFSLQLWVNSRTNWLFSLGEATSLGEGQLWIQTC